MSLTFKNFWSILLQTAAAATRFLLLLLAMALPSQAILDLNGNGVSDLWEERYNAGNPFSTFDPTADPDGDGWANDIEAVAGTDPLNGTSPVGCVRPVITHIPAVYTTGTAGELVIVTPEAITLTWPTVVGKIHTLQYSPDLSPQSWILVRNYFNTNGNPITRGIQLAATAGTRPDTGFWRVVIKDMDSDNDRLTNTEESQLGTHPSRRDSDGDGVSDWDEVTVNFTNPLTAADADADTIPDDFEKALSAKLLNHNSNPAAWATRYAGLIAGNLDATHDYTGDGTTAAQLFVTLSGAGSVDPQTTKYLTERQATDAKLEGFYIAPFGGNPAQDNITFTQTQFVYPFTNISSNQVDQAAATAAYLGARSSTAPWYRNTNPASRAFNIYDIDGMTSLSYFQALNNMPTSYNCRGSIIQERFRLCAMDLGHEPLSIQLLRVTSQKPYTASNDPSSAPATILSVEPLNIEIPANLLLSDWVELKPPLTPNAETTQSIATIEVNYVDRDIMGNQWEQKKAYLASKPDFYAGPNSGDMVEWRLPEVTILQGQPIAWKAEHLGSGEIIPGPSGINVNFWRIANEGGNDPIGDEWLKWKPGDYRITCELVGLIVEIQRVRVGYRSDQILVIGQIVPTVTHNADEPVGAALGPWANAIADDLSGVFSTAAGILPSIVENEVYDAIRSKIPILPSKAAEAWTGVWSGGIPGLAAPILPPLSRGPAATSYGLNLRGPVGTITAPHRYWMIQHLLNTNSDTPILPATLPTSPATIPNGESFPEVFSNKQYRFLQRFQARFLLDPQGKIENPASRVFSHIADVGPTKLNAGLVIGELGSVAGFPIPWTNLSVSILTESAETNTYNGTINYSADGKSMSGYATARIGLKGQQASYRQFGKDAPWIFSEVILQLDPQGEVQLMGRTSTTVQWKFDTSLLTPEVTVIRSPYAPASTPGISVFNNLNIYTRSSIDEFKILRNGILKMEGHLSGFVESTSGAWPEPPIAPSIR